MVLNNLEVVMADRKISTVPDFATLVHGRDNFEYMALYKVKLEDRAVTVRILFDIRKVHSISRARLEVFSKHTDNWNVIDTLASAQMPVRYEDMPTPQEAWDLFKDNDNVAEPMNEYLQNPEGRKLFDEFYPDFARNTNENFEAIIERLLTVAEILYL
jgi:hypothetical protein